MVITTVGKHLGIALKSPFSVQLELTEDCNHRCNYCYNFWNYESHNNNTQPLQQFDFKKIIDRLVEAEVFQIILTGGEPFLRKDILFSLISYCHSKGLDIDINTNLTAVHKTELEKLSGAEIGILVSFPSFKEETYAEITGSNTYSTFIKNLEIIVQQNHPLSVNMVVTQLNKSEVYNTGKFLIEHFGISSFSATPLSGTKGADAHKGLGLDCNETLAVLDELVRLHKDYDLSVDSLQPLPFCIYPKDKIEIYAPFLKRSCAAGKTTFTISPSGNIRPCSHASQAYGNVLEQSVSDIWQDMGEWRTKRFIPNECKECSVLDYCLGGCRTNAEYSNSSLSANDPLTVGKITNGDYIINAKEKVAKTAIKGDKFLIQEGFKYRKECEGVFTVYSKGDMLIVNEQILNVLLNAGVIDTVGLNETGLGVVSVLLNNNLLKKV